MAFNLKTKPTAKKTVAKKAAPKKLAASKKVAARSRYEDDDEDVEPARPRKVSGAKKAAPPRAGGGWVVADSRAESTGGDFIQSVKFQDGTTHVVRFLEDQPYASLKVHWIQRSAGKRSFICPETADCPLCAIGNNPRFEARFNVAVLTEDAPLARSLNVGRRLYDDLKALHNNASKGPLTKRTYEISRTGTGLKTKYSANTIRKSDLEEEYPELHVPSADELEEMTVYTLDDIEDEYSTMDDLEEVADLVASGAADDEE